MSKIKIKTLPNGVRIVVDTFKVQKSFQIAMGINYGALNENENEEGLTHFLEHMFFEQHKKFKTSEDRAEFGYKNFIKSNGCTGTRTICFYGGATTSKEREFIDSCVDLFFDFKLDENTFLKEKNVIKTEIDSIKSKNQYNLFNKMWDYLYEKSGKKAHDISGTKEKIENYTTEDIMNHYTKIFKPENLVFAFAGNISFNKALKIYKKFFLPHLPKENKLPNFSDLSVKRIEWNKEIVQFKIERNIPIVYIAYNFENNYTKKDSILNLLLDIVNKNILHILRYDKKLVYSCGFEYSNLIVGGFVYFRFEALEKNIPLVLKIIKKIIDNYKSIGVNQEDFDIEKERILLRKFCFLKKYADNIEAEKLASSILRFGKIFKSQEENKKILAVTKQDVDELAKEIFSSDPKMFIRSTTVDPKWINLLCDKKINIKKDFTILKE